MTFAIALPMKHHLVALSFLMAAFSGAAPSTPGWLKDSRVIWESPSQDSLDSMPLSGRHGAGANVWVQAGAIWIYLAHNGASGDRRPRRSTSNRIRTKRDMINPV
jgi:hypothetical protein